MKKQYHLICVSCEKPYSLINKRDAKKSRFCSKSCWYNHRGGFHFEDGHILKTCSKCHAKKATTEFNRRDLNKAKPTKRPCIRSECKACQKHANKIYNKINAEHRMELSRAYRAKYPERVKEWAKRRHQTIRSELITMLGGKCACCAEDNVDFLTLDHVNNDGNEHRRLLFNNNKTGSTTRMYREVRKQGYPRDKYQILCYNCNLAKARYGRCPHSEETLKNGSGSNFTSDNSGRDGPTVSSRPENKISPG